MRSRSNEYDNFASLLRDVVKVPHSVIKAKLEADKVAKKRKPKRASSSSSRVKCAKPTSD